LELEVILVGIGGDLATGFGGIDVVGIGGDLYII